MDQRRRRVGCGKLVLQRQLTCLEVDQLLLQSAHWRIVIGDQLDDPANAALDASEVSALGLGCSVYVDAQTVDLAMELLADSSGAISWLRNPSRIIASSVSRRMFKRLVQVPRLRAAAQPNRLALILT